MTKLEKGLNLSLQTEGIFFKLQTSRIMLGCRWQNNVFIFLIRQLGIHTEMFPNFLDILLEFAN
jgi:hypothetical protein